jgi:hypothetical protein
MPRALVLPLFFAASLAQADPVTDHHSFAVTLAGVRAATLTLSGTEDAGRYRVEGRIESDGVAAVVRRVRYVAQASGRVAATRYEPDRYSELFDTPRRQSQAELTYERGVPRITTYQPPLPPETEAVDPADQGGTVDPLTALYAGLRDTPLDQACGLSLQVFDGRRRSQVTLSNPVPQGERVLCTGEYRRISGFSDREMRERARFPFTATLAPIDANRLRVVEVRVETIFGRATLRRD